MTKKERKEIRKRERLEMEAKEVQKKRIIKPILTALLLIGIGWLLVTILKEFLKPAPGQAVPNQGRGHLEIGQSHDPYNSNPPTSGPHYDKPANYGIHEAFVPNEYQVHNLEHGGVIVHYKCLPLTPVASPSAEPVSTLSAEASVSARLEAECLFTKSQLSQIVAQYPSKVMLIPNPNLDNKIALTAWTRVDTFDEIDFERVKKFIDYWQDRGPESVSDEPTVYFP